MRLELISTSHLRVHLDGRRDVMKAIGPNGVFRSLDVESDELMSYLLGEQTVVDVRESEKAVEEFGGYEQVVVRTDFLDPYWARIKRQWGVDPFALDLTPAFPVAHTYYPVAAETDGVTTTVSVIYHVHAGPFGNRGLRSEEDRRALALKRATHYVNATIGEIPYEPEFIANSTGCYRHNPNYLTQRPPRPAVTNERIWGLLWAHFLEHLATPAQRDAVSRFSVVKGRENNAPGLKDYAIYLDDYHQNISWETFATLTDTVVPTKDS